jgi:hypothetical protein
MRWNVMWRARANEHGAAPGGRIEAQRPVAVYAGLPTMRKDVRVVQTSVLLVLHAVLG